MTGDWGGTRTSLQNRGLNFTINDIEEAFGVFFGGVRQQASYEGQFEFTLDADLSKLAGWSGTSFHFTTFQIRDSGRNVAENAGSIADPSNIDAMPTFRLYTAWIEKDFGDGLSVRVGQLAADGDFATSDAAGGLLNGTFGWPGLMAANMTNGGPAYPLATPGIRVQKAFAHNITVLAGVFSGDPAGRNCDKDPQKCNKYGTKFSFSGGSLWMGELQYGPGHGPSAKGLSATYKVGAWYQTGHFSDQHYGRDNSGAVVSLGVDSSAEPLKHNGDWGVYGAVDRMVWRGKSSDVTLFLRAGFAPSDRNLISFYADGGFAARGLLDRRPDDVLSFGIAYGKISSDASAADRDARAGNSLYPVRSAESVLELGYTANLAPWWTVQPDVQYVIHPGGKVVNPDNANETLGNALIAGIRSTISF